MLGGTSMSSRLFILLVLAVSTQTLTLDQEATSAVITTAKEARDDGELVIVVRGPHGRSTRREELLHAKTSEDAAVSLYYNRKSNKVSLESLHGGHLKSVSWTIGSHRRGTLMLVVASNRVKLVIGCKPLHWHAMSGQHDLMPLLKSQHLKLYHEENAPVEVYTSERAALDSLSCDIQNDFFKTPAHVTEASDMEEIKDYMEREERKKREEEQMQGDDYRANYIDSVLGPTTPSSQRGDIPSNGIETCDDEVIRQLQLLRQTIDSLRKEVADQKRTIDSLRQCCQRQPAVERCSGSSCYPGY